MTMDTLTAVTQSPVRTNAASVLVHFGYLASSRPGWQKVHCPFHDDANASASVNAEEDKFRCHGCGTSGSGWDIAQALSNSTDEALELFTTNSKAPPTVLQSQQPQGYIGPKPPTPRAMRALEDATKAYQSHVAELKDYLTARGFTGQDASRFRLGYVKEPAPGHEAMAGRLAIPYITPAGVVSMRFRSVTEDKPKYLGLPGETTRLFGVNSMTDMSKADLFITEGEFDALTLQALGLVAVGVPGANAWKKHYGLIAEDFSLVRVIGDGDKAGRGFVHAVAADVGDAVGLVTPDGLDINDLYVQHGRDAVLEFLGVAA